MEKSRDLDQFYTNPTIAELFVKNVGKYVDYESFDNIIEPSAGAGYILDCLPDNKIGIDIDPKRKDIIKTDLFDYDFPMGNNMVIGNPPFGKNSKLAIEFFNRCAIHVDVIAFIIPRSWLKYKTQSKLNLDFGLYYNMILPKDSFILDDKPYDVRCIGQLWMRREFASSLSSKYIKSQFDSYDDEINEDLLLDLYKYQSKHKCYERSTMLL